MRRDGAREVTWAACLLGAFLVLLPSGLLAQPTSSADELKRGADLINAHQYTEAADAFEQAYKTFGEPTFLYNAAVAAEMAQDLHRASDLYDAFLVKEPHDASATAIRTHSASLKVGLGAAPPQPATAASLRSIVKIDTEPSGAPITMYERIDPAAVAFSGTEPPPGWAKVGDKAFTTPTVFSVKVGHYHVVIESFRDYHTSVTDLDVVPGYFYSLRASLSQGSFLAFLRVTSPVEGAKVYIDRAPSPTAPVWGRTPKSDFIEGGDHDVWIEATGYEPYHQKVRIDHGQTIEVRAALKRVSYGFVRFDSEISYFSITVDSQPAEKYDWTKGPSKLRLPAGPHRVRLTADGKKDYEGIVDVPAGQMLDTHAHFTEAMSYGGPVVLGVLAVACGAGAGIAASYANDLPAKDQAKSTFGNLTIAGIVGAGAFAAASIFFFIDFGPGSKLLLEKPKEFDAGDGNRKKSGLSGGISPLFSVDFGGVAVHALF